MNEEKKRILEMVSDGTITPSEGARLLEALGSAGYMRERPRQTRRKPLLEATAILSEVGPMIQETMGDIFKGSRKSNSSLDGLDFQEVDSFSREIEDDHEIIIHGKMNKGRGLCINITGSKENVLKAEVEQTKESLSVVEKNGKTILLWKSGTLNVSVPDCAGSLKVTTQGGSIFTDSVGVPSKLNTMGGSISVRKPSSSFSAKTMGGNLEISLNGSWNENSKAKSMGGGISISLAEGISVDLSASTLGGAIDAGKLEHVVVSSSDARRGGAKMRIQYGDSDDSPKLAGSTMGGDIEIRGESIE